MKIVDSQRIKVRVRIEGTIEGEPFVYEDSPDSNGSQYIWRSDNGDGWGDPSEYWWSEGNFACDCNRAEFVPEGLRHLIPPFVKGDFDYGPGELLGEFACGHVIMIDSIVPIEQGPEGEELPSLYLHESAISPSTTP